MIMGIRPIILVGIALLLLACGQPQIATPRPPAVSAAVVQTLPAVQASWLTSSTCRPPCWEGITPGVTTITATVAILQAHPLLLYIPGPPGFTPRDGEHQFDWAWPAPSSRGAYAYARKSAVTIEYIDLNLDASVSFATIQTQFGAPSHALLVVIPDPHSRDVTWKLDLIFVDQGMILTALSPTPPRLDTAAFDQVLLTYPDKAQFESLLYHTVWYPWEEGAPLTTYCDRTNNAEPCLLFR